ncbi:hypothetical protein GRS48_10345 [Halorubrum sp. JWXQ-INN 858]|uniref:hypothetical protein n=1 Tax=Halorubrum sp. JWXQ-INN 858 TaxID=2690782 RepID=UPI001356D1A2|nr:hypothetical protein [Halorubrum sp. JWXQ-INN 858]MWV65216.1 hypothetical protein [Halorubrum sp. JWXQ-INN 858]
MSRSNRSLLRRALKHPDVLVASAKYHVRRVITRPIRTAISVVFAYAFLIALVTFTTETTALMAILDEGASATAVLPLLPSPPLLALFAVVSVVVVPVSMVTTGVRRDLRSSQSRRRRLEE